MPIVLNNVTNTEKLSLINANFQKIEDAINDSLLWREGNTAGEAQMSRPLDMNNGQILNALVGNLRLSALAEDLTASVVSAANSAISASASEANAAVSAGSAAGDAVNANISAINAAASAASVASSASQINTNTSDIAALTTRVSNEETKVNSVALGGTGASTASVARTNLGAAASGANTDITSITGSAAKLTAARTVQTNLGSTASASFDGTANISPGVTGTLPVGNGGTGSTTASGARTALGAAASGANTDITSLQGTTAGTNAATGKVGEILTATTSGTSISSGVTVNIASLSLTPGDWDVTGAFQVNTSSAQIYFYAAGINTTSATVPTFPNLLQWQFGTGTTLATSQHNEVVPVRQINVAATTTVYLVYSALFGTGSATVDGFIRARRMR